MTRDAAIKKLSKRYGKKACYRVNEKASTAIHRETARIEIGVLQATRDELRAKLEKRRQELLAGDEEYQRLDKEVREARKAVDDKLSIMGSYKFEAGYIDGVLGAFHITGQGDTWEEVFEKIDKHHSSSRGRG